ncbi:MAG: hypothetical protein Q8M96_10175, partial [Rubrivivax sp.]|nr:hypothetical protein [Rubrivivax sp.]
KRNLPIMLDQASLPWFVELNRSLVDPHTPEEFTQRLQESATRLRQLATEILDRAAAEYPQLDGSPLLRAIEAAGGLVRLPEKLLFPALGETQDEALAV